MVPRRILLIDDNDDVLEVARLSLRLNRDWDVETATSGEEGVERAKAAPPDAILLDVQMPDLDGPETLRLLQSDENTRNVPVVFLTGRSEPDERTYFAQLGALGVIDKPFDPITLSHQVAETLGWEEGSAR